MITQGMHVNFLPFFDKYVKFLKTKKALTEVRVLILQFIRIQSTL